MMNKEINYYVDMDGVVARWCLEDTTYDTFQPGYFLSRTPEPELVRLVKMLRDKGKNVFILSSVYQNGYAEKEKRRWLSIQGIGDVPKVFVPYGENKADYTDSPNTCNILLDDFSKNLLEWEEAGNLGFKLYNGINGNYGKWKGNCLHIRMTAETMFRVLTSVSEAWAKEKAEEGAV